MKTHKVLKNAQGKCVIRKLSDHEPPGWTVSFSGTEDECKAWYNTSCGPQNVCQV